MPDDALLNQTISLSAERVHDRLCDELERGWLAGQPPRIEDLLKQVSADQQRDLFVALLRVEFEYRSSPPAGEYQSRFPQFANLVERLQHDPALDTCEFSPVLPAIPTPPSINGLETLGMIAAGGMGIVYRAWEAAKDRSVAIKTMKSGVSNSPDFLKRFRREAWAVAQLTHRGIVQLYSFGDCDGVPHYVMEFVEGGSLNDRLDGGPKDPGWSANLVEQLARTMQYVHDRGIVHRDLKPANILMATERREDSRDGDEKVLIPKIADFGLAKRLTDPETGLTIPGTVLGTASYMSPEQATGLDEVGKPADIYGLGAVLFELLTGRPPFRAATRDLTVEMVRNDDPPYPTDVNPSVPDDLETICLRCLEKEPTQRYLSAADLAEDLQRWSEGRPILAPPFRGPERDAKWAMRIGYEIIGFLGMTGGAALYSAVQKSIDRRVVLKLSSGRAGSRQHDALKREATFLPTIDSPYVLRLLDYGERYGQPYLVLDHVEGGVLLSSMLRDPKVSGLMQKPLTPRRAAEVCLMIAVGVQNLHDHGVLHAGLHSGCVMLSREMMAKLIGFETARRLDEPIAGDFLQSPKGVPPVFIAPELLAGRADRVGRATDVYGLGAILYDLLTGRPPFIGTSIDEVRDLVLHELPIAPRQFESTVPIALEAICLRALNKDPAKRYMTIGAIALELQQFLRPSDPNDDSTVGPTDSAPPLKQGPADAYQLRILSGPTKVGESIALSSEQIKIGRSRDCQIVLTGSMISHLHCGIVWDGQHQLVDYGSKNGTYLNGEPVETNRSLSPGDLIQLPSYVLQYEVATR